MANFLEEILGPDGAVALSKAVEKYPPLQNVIAPRSVVAWLSTMGKIGYDGELPGTPDSYFSLIKTEKETYSGALTIKDQLYTFENADMLHVAASVGVALGIEVGPVDEQLKKRDLTKLGKSIDLLVKTEIVKKLKKQKELQKELANYSHYFKITKSESERDCVECGTKNFVDGKFVGCLCFSALAPSVRVNVVNDEYTLSFKNDLDEDAVSALCEALKI